MTLLLNLRKVGEEHLSLVGGKAWRLARLAGLGFRVPSALCVTTEAYHRYLRQTGVRDRIGMILERKAFGDMRWEEIWDVSLRIRNLFLRTPLPTDLEETLRAGIGEGLPEVPVAVRSSAPEEDALGHSYAGLHASYVNIRSLEGILDHLPKVWASLWSDAALLYRREMGLRVGTSAMAVVVQEFVPGESSGVAFSRSPDAPDRVAIEAVHGLNQGLVDGEVEPDRWVLERTTGSVLAFDGAERECQMAPLADGVGLTALDPDQRTRPPLGPQELSRIRDLVLRAEEIFRGPQDVEWTLRGGELFLLQSRPITAGTERKDSRGEASGDDRRPWYLSLRRSYANLRRLRRRIEDELLPAMVGQAQALSGTPLSGLSDAELAREIEGRAEIYDRWKSIYWQDFIPFAHGARLFGEFYNDTVRPEDPHEFVALLEGAALESVRRNDRLGEIAVALRADPDLPDRGDTRFERALETFLADHGGCTWGEEPCLGERSAVLRLAREMAAAPAGRPAGAVSRQAKTEEFLGRVDEDRRDFAKGLLDLARASYRLRDDDNIHLGAIRGRWMEAVEEGRNRLRDRGAVATGLRTERVPAALRGEAVESGETGEGRPLPAQGGVAADGIARMRVRQVVGQPASPGIAQGAAKVVADGADLLSFRAGEVLVCDAIEPNMTFVVPLAAAIVERRGGMLIHGAIIAREYGIPCVTGVPDAARVIRTGDRVTVDGYLGIVVVDARPEGVAGPGS